MFKIVFCSLSPSLDYGLGENGNGLELRYLLGVERNVMEGRHDNTIFILDKDTVLWTERRVC